MKVNKLKRQLIAIGLSAMTAVTMVSPVFADETPNTENTTQVQTVSETTKTITVNLIKSADSTSVGSVSVTVNDGLDDNEEYSAVYQALSGSGKIPNGYEIDGGMGASGPMVSKNSDGTYTAYLATQKDVNVTIKKNDDESYQQTYSVKVRDGLIDSLERSFVYAGVSSYIPENYTGSRDNLVKNTDGTYTLTVIKASTDLDTTTYYLYVIKDEKSVSSDESFSVSSSMTEDEIKTYIYNNYYDKYAEGETVTKYMIEKTGDYSYCLSMTLNKERTYKLEITKDGVEQETTTFKLTSSYRDDDAVYKYLQENYVPKGYDGYVNSHSYGEDITYCLTLNKNKYAGEGKRTYTLKIIDLASNYVWNQWTGMDENVLKNAKVEYKTFEFDASAKKYEFVNYINEHFAPEGYQVYDPTTYVGIDKKYCPVYQVDENTWVMLGPNYQATSSEGNQYTIKYLDVDTNNFVNVEVEDSNGSIVPVISTATIWLKDAKTELTVSEINSLPTGYVFVGDSFEVVNDGNNQYSVTAKVKKGEFKTPVTVDYYVNNNGTLEYYCTKTAIAEDLDANNSGVVNFQKELTSIVPDGYVVSNLNRYGYFYYDTAKLHAMMKAEKYDELSEEFNGTGWGTTVDTNQAYSIHVSCYLEKIAGITIEKTSDLVSLDDSKAANVLVASLNAGLKEKYDAAVSSGKKVEFTLTITTKKVNSNEVVSIDKVVTEKGYQTVEAFDITLVMTVDGEKVGAINETSSELTFKVTFPENLKKDGRKFYVLRYHDGKVTKLDVSDDGTFTTDKFSTYMLVYEDVKQSTDDTSKKEDSKSDTADKKDDASSTTDKTGSSTSDTKKTNLISSKTNKTTTSKSVNTSAKTNSSLFVGFGALALTGTAIVGVLKKKNELD